MHSKDEYMEKMHLGDWRKGHKGRPYKGDICTSTDAKRGEKGICEVKLKKEGEVWSVHLHPDVRIIEKFENRPLALPSGKSFQDLAFTLLNIKVVQRYLLCDP